MTPGIIKTITFEVSAAGDYHLYICRLEQTYGSAMAEAFGNIMREWRSIRRFSQLQLSVEAEISSRHLSFLESGRAHPSRSMVMKLGDALQMPKAMVNQALGAAGFTPAFPQLPPDDTALAPVRAAVDYMLINHAPLPAIAIDRHWDIIGANPPALELFAIGGVAGAGNVIDAMIAFAEDDLLENWVEAAYLFLVRLRVEIAHYGGDHTLERYADQIARHPRLKGAALDQIDLSQAVAPTIFNIGGERLSLFSTIAQFGTVQEVTASDIRIEMMFPADDATRRYFENRQ